MFKPPRCKECEYWRKDVKDYKKKVVGQCKAGRPTLGPNGYGYWPVTVSDDFCYKGAHMEKPLLTEEKEDVPAGSVLFNERIMNSSVPDKPTPPPAPPAKRYDIDNT